MPFGPCAGEVFRYVTMVFLCRSGTYGILLLDHNCPEDNNLSVSQRFRYPALTYDLSYTNFVTSASLSNLQRFGRYPALTYDLSYTNFVMSTTLSNLQRFDRYKALTYDLSYTNFLLPLSNAQCSSKSLCAAHASVSQYYGSTNEKHYAFSNISISYPPCRRLEQQATVENIYEECMLSASASVWKHLLRMTDIVLSFLSQLSSESDSILIRIFLQAGRHCLYIGYDCLYLSRNLSRICIALYLRFQQTLHTKHDFHALKKRLIGRITSLQGMPLVTFFRNCTGMCGWQKCRTGFTSRFKLNRSIPHFTNSVRFRSLLLADDMLSNKPSSQNKHQARQTTFNLGGSASRLFEFSLIGDHLTSDRSIVSQDSMFRFVAHVDDVGLLAYSSSQFVHTNIPLKALFKFLPVSHARKIASVHCIPAGSRCSIAELLMHVENHLCLQCSSHLTVFSVEKNNDQLNCKRVSECRERKLKLREKKNIVPEVTVSVASEFPPLPATANLTDLILSKACKKMDPKAIEEAGCAVCGELKPLQKMSRLKSVKNYLGVLEAPGVTRIERRTDTQIKEYTGPVLDYACSHICDTCRRDVRKGKVPRLALANNLWLGKVPNELKNLRFVEKLLIARVRHTCAYAKVASGMRKMKANVVAFESPIPKIYSVLPPPREDLDEVLAILFTGPSKPTSEDFSRTPFLVRRNAVIAALEWLKFNHADYANIEISREHMDQYDEDMPPVSIEYRESITNKVPEGTSVFDQEEEEGTEKGDCAFTVHGLTGETLNSMSPNAIKILALRHLNNNGKMLAVGRSDKLESMWNNPQLYPQMFPWLFPYGLGGVGASNISHKEHKRHLLMYHDK